VKKALKIGLIVLGVLVVVLVIGYLAIDSIAKTAVEKGGTYAMGVPTKVDSVSVGLFKGEVGMDGLTISNPSGFKTPHFLKTGRLEVGVEPGSLTKDTIIVTRFVLDGVDLNFEHGAGTTNVQALLNNMESPSASTAEKKEPAKEGGKKIKVNKVVIKNIVAHVQLLPIGGQATTLDVKIPELTLDNVSSDDAAGVALPELMKRLVPAILTAVIDKGKGSITDADFNKLGENISKTTKALGDSFQKGGENLNKAAKDAADALQKGADPLKKGIEGLFGEKKK
jgi:uncharacterized protein involved in outer membrane biogenesis